jgi:uncharacterized protein YdaU (DUF1376 family)
MAKEKAPHMPFYGREFYADENVLVMTLEQEAAYLRLLWNCWQEGSIPEDAAKLAAICKNTSAKRFGKDIWPALHGCFSSTPDGRLVHRKVETLRDAKNAHSAERALAGKLGAEIRWRGKKNQGDDDGSTMAPAIAQPQGTDGKHMSADCRLPTTDCQLLKTPNTCASGDARVGDPLPIDPPLEATQSEAAPTAVTKKPTKSIDDLTPQQETWFAEWWPTYWRHVARKPARKAFGKQVRTAAKFEQVMAATRAQMPVMLGKEPQFRPHGATWLNEERWADLATELVNQETAEERVARLIYGEKTA